MPDEKIRVEGDLLRGWSEFWEQTRGIISYQYKGGQLEEKYKVLKAANSKLAAKLTIAPEKMSLMGEINSEDRSFIQDYLQVRVFTNADNVFLFLDEPKYLFPKFMRYILSTCHVCLASPVSFGGLSWLAFCLFSQGTYSPYPWTWLLWIPYCIALSFVNYLVGRKAEL